MKTSTLRVFAAVVCVFAPIKHLRGQGTAFTYQGSLASNGSPAQDAYDLTFTLFQTNNGGVPVAGPITNAGTVVTAGLFTSVLDFGENVFTGSNYWLEMGVKPTAGSSFTTLSPRQPVTPTPYAIFAPNAGSAVVATSVAAGGTVPLTALPGTVVVNGEDGVVSIGNLVNDTRPLANADLKGPLIAQSNTLFVLMTNNGPCTIKSIRIDLALAGPPASQQTIDTALVSVFADGISNGFTLKSFLCAQFQPPKFHGQIIDLCESAPSTVMGERLVNINAYSNASVCITCNQTSIEDWSDVTYKAGIPVAPSQQRVWHAIETMGILPAGQVNTTVNYSGGPGQVESVVGCLLSTNGQGYLEARPTFTLDGASWYRNGTEDFFGGVLYWDEGTDNYANAKDGSECESALAGIPSPWTDGNSSYVFLDGMTFNNSMSFSYPNVTSFNLSNIWLVTYWTAQ
ncbi:MAG TPA: hypothetical protein VH619_09320 [Verrucomicrobiae bacterium]|jgi:hypothetical protein|nr:hypothetical protein [Verrucomicrobiae bacterium]